MTTVQTTTGMFVAVLFLTASTIGEQSSLSICPEGWSVFEQEAHKADCLWLSNYTVDSFAEASKACAASGGFLASSSVKMAFVKKLLRQSGASEAWLGLTVSTGRHFFQQTAQGRKRLYLRSYELGYVDIHDSGCFSVNLSRTFKFHDCSGPMQPFVCQKARECSNGTYGSRCENECHCQLLPCDTESWEPKCHYGCQKGWRGESCNQEVQKPSISYNCVNPVSGQKHVDVKIDTKGTKYRHVIALDEYRKETPWCADTQVTSFDFGTTVELQIVLSEEAMRRGWCAGKEISPDVYQWDIVVKEWQSVHVSQDEEFEIRCNFSASDSLSRTVQTVVNGPADSQASQVAEMNEEVAVEVVDAMSRLSLASYAVGSSVRLKVSFGLKGTNATGIFPFNCIATSDDGSQRVLLLDSNGCQTSDSPVKPFSYGTKDNVVETPWFSYFTFNGSPRIDFRCSYQFCYYKQCRAGCLVANSLARPLKGIN